MRAQHQQKQQDHRSFVLVQLQSKLMWFFLMIPVHIFLQFVLEENHRLLKLGQLTDYQSE